MGEELLKRKTDCVYFLASPLTCKKGVDCDYRHSETARMNPRDCWYWSSGNCLNPTCGFRHPPMDSNSETSAEKTSLPSTKNNVPCYFYFNGYCGKGDKCTFLHGSRKSPHVVSVPKITTGNPDPPEMALKTSDKVQSSDTSTVAEHNVLSGFEEPAISKLASFDPPGYSNESSEDQKDSVQDEWWESSPGFDVLVEGNSEQEYMQNEASYYSDDDERYDLHDYHHMDRGRNNIMSQKRKLPNIGLPIGGHHYYEDLREHLSKRRYHEEQDFHTQETRREPQMSSDAFVIIPEQKGRDRNREIKTRHNHHHEMKRQKNPSFSRKKKESNNNGSFAPPKTLAQIKEEKYRRRSSGGEEDVNIVF